MVTVELEALFPEVGGANRSFLSRLYAWENSKSGIQYFHYVGAALVFTMELLEVMGESQ